MGAPPAELHTRNCQLCSHGGETRQQTPHQSTADYSGLCLFIDPLARYYDCMKHIQRLVSSESQLMQIKENKNILSQVMVWHQHEMQDCVYYNIISNVFYQRESVCLSI